MDRLSVLPTLFGRSNQKGYDVFSQLQNEIDRVFENFSVTRPTSLFTGNGGFEPTIDVSESTDAIDVMAEMPGCDAKDVDISLVGQTLTLRGEKKAEKESNEKNYHSVERSYGAFVRTITLPFEADPSKVEASFDKGVLKVHLPKPPGTKHEIKKIPIKGQ